MNSPLILPGHEQPLEPKAVDKSAWISMSVSVSGYEPAAPQSAKLSAPILLLIFLLGGLAEVKSTPASDPMLLGNALSSPDPKAALTGASESEPPQQRVGPRASQRGVYKAQINPHWFQNNTRFWYRNDLKGGAKEFIMVDADMGKRQSAFDHQKLGAALSKVTGEDYPADRLPFSEIEYIENGRAVRIEAANKTWKCNLDTYECAAFSGRSESSPERTQPNQGSGNRRSQSEGDGQGERGRSPRSPDGKWTAFIKENNVFLRSNDDGKETQLSQDGQEGNVYGRLEWAPYGKVLIGWRIAPGDRKEVYLVQWAPPGGERAVLKTRPYALPGDKFTRYELSIFDIANRTQVKPEVDRFEHEWESPRLHWQRDGRHFAYTQVDRGHQRLRVIETDSLTGGVRNLVDEHSQTFIWTAHAENLGLRLVNWLEKTDEMIYVSERDGWRHLYLVDAREGKIKNQMTQGEYVVRAIDRIDEENRQVWFRACGKNPGQDPYLIHYYRVNFDGTGLVALTEGNGQHTIQYSPDRKYLIDTYSRVDLAPRHELRRVADGTLVCPLEEADISELQAGGWEPPEVFVAKGRDGKTDIWGIICRPLKLDPQKKYPVLEQIYAGPQGSFVPKTFSGTRRFSELTDLGFVVVQMDGMGTANRSKAFHDVCWKNLKDAGFPDRILWHKAAAAKYSWYDVSRVGIYGTSAGGQSAAGALLFYPEFYKAAVANCGCHDNRMDKASWNEQWMGYPVGPQYRECSNLENAGKLQGRLFLVVGGMDDNVPPESTFRFVDALIKANKDFDLLVVPSGGHGSGGAYGQRRLQDFFLRYLQGVEPPNRNAATEPAAGAEKTRFASPPAASVNLAVVATPSASYVSGDTTVAAVNDGATPRSSRDNRRGSYGNWNRTGTQWVQYDWSQPISTSRIEVYWWADGAGINVPKACRLKYWDGDSFVPVGNPSGLGVLANQFNVTTFDEVRTFKLRLEIESDGRYSTGILEWKVYDSGKSPPFPPRVVAGVDRAVVLGAKTYLNGAVKSLTEGAPFTITWSKESGPGNVNFADAHEAVTTAAFSALGDYVLKLTAQEGALDSTSTLKVTVAAPPPAAHLNPVYTKTYKINSPLWSQRVKALLVNWIPHCMTKLSDPNAREGGINNFVQAANKLAGNPYTRHVGYPFADAYTHNTVESMCVALMVDPQGDEEINQAQASMRAKLEDWIPKILAAQEPDGYLQTRFTLDTRNPAHWDPRTRSEHEGYVAGYFLEAALAHYLMTDKKDARMYNAAKKLADCWYNNIGPSPKKAWFDGHQEMEQALVRLGRFVNDVEGGEQGRKYIDLAKFLLDCRKDGDAYDQTHLPVIQQYEAVGHAVRAAYSYSGMADVAMETGDPDYGSAVKSLWDNIVNKKYYVTGGIGSGETSEGFGPNYSLRNNAYCESCSSCGELFFQYKLNLTYHDTQYADLFEETLYNAILGDIDLAGNNFYYQNPLDGGRPRYPWHNCPCCVGNIPRTLLMLPTWMYAKNADGIYVNLFIGSTVTVENVAGTDVQMVQSTDYPWSGKVSIVVNPAAPKRFAVRIRAPQRDVSRLYVSKPEANGIISLVVNGASITPVLDRGYASITRDWQAGDKIELVLPMKVQRVKAIPQVAADRGRVALRYGPLIYNIESVDQNIDAVLDPSSDLTTEWRPELLGGVVIIKGPFADGSAMTAIPNYARCNRIPEGSTENRGRSGRSIVWLKDQ